MFGRKKQDAAAGGTEAQPEKKKGWFSRLKDGLTKSTDKITDGIDAVIDEAPEEAPAPAGLIPEPTHEPAPEQVSVTKPDPAPPPEPAPAPPRADAPPSPPTAPSKPPEPAKSVQPEAKAKTAAVPEPAAAEPVKAEPVPPVAAKSSPTVNPAVEPAPVKAKTVETTAHSEPAPAAPAAPDEKTPPPAPPPEDTAPDDTDDQKARPGLAERIVRFVRRRKLDDAALEAIEEVLITADLGPAAAAKLTANLARDKFDKAVSSEEIREALAENVAEILAPVAQPLTPDGDKRPHVVLVVGVNGSGKTTTIGKLGKQWADEGRTITFAAGDTFRAAAVEQLKIWGDRVGAHVVARDPGADAAGLAFDALKEAAERGDDVLLVDTAGRLQNKADLMAELEKIVRVLRKLDESAPHSVLLVLDATVGQNAHSQVQIFKEIAEVSGLIVTKLDGSAKGGVIVALAETFGLPIHAIGVGEGADDMRPFEPRDFARSLMGLEG